MVPHTRLVRTLCAVAVLLVVALCEPCQAAGYGDEQDNGGCVEKNAPDMAHYYACLATARDAERQRLAKVTAGVIAIANRYAPDIARAEQDWLKWMDSECTLEGLLDDGSAAPTPWLERCQLRMMTGRERTMAALQKVLLTLSAPSKTRRSTQHP